MSAMRSRGCGEGACEVSELPGYRFGSTDGVPFSESGQTSGREQETMPYSVSEIEGIGNLC